MTKVTLSRWQADLLLVLVAFIWGFAFIAQKTGMNGMGPFGFVGVRFLLSFLVIVPLAWREYRDTSKNFLPAVPLWQQGLLVLLFFGGVISQQFGLKTATVTNAGFLTTLYVLFVPILDLLFFRIKPRTIIWPAAVLAIFGVYLLGGGGLSPFSIGDWLIIACACSFAGQVMLMGHLARNHHRPFYWSILQYGFCAVVGIVLAFAFEEITINAIMKNIWPLLYGGLISGGIAYTLQAITQRYTPSSDAAIIMSGEALFAALGGFILLQENLHLIGWVGCGLIFAAIILTELPIGKTR